MKRRTQPIRGKRRKRQNGDSGGNIGRVPVTGSKSVSLPAETAQGAESAEPAGLREWDRATRFMAMFAMTGWLSELTEKGDVRPLRPASIMLIGTPGSGKTELIRRFRACYWLSYHSDLTVRALLPLLRRAEMGVLTHIAAEEFNKFFQRKLSVSENCVGLLAQAMEEGVSTYSVGPMSLSFDFARLGLFAGMTPRTMLRRRELLAEMGFLSRACVLEWQLPRAEHRIIIERINSGDDRDLTPVRLPVPQGGQRAVIKWDMTLGEPMAEYVRTYWPENDLRIFQRFRSLMMASAYLSGRDRVSQADADVLMGYDDYWRRMVLE